MVESPSRIEWKAYGSSFVTQMSMLSVIKSAEMELTPIIPIQPPLHCIQLNIIEFARSRATIIREGFAWSSVVTLFVAVVAGREAGNTPNRRADSSQEEMTGRGQDFRTHRDSG